MAREAAPAQAGGQEDKLGLIAGGGPLPLRLAEACRDKGRPFHVIALEGMAEEEITAYTHSWTPLGSFGRILSILKDNDCTTVAMAGIVKRPDFSKLKLDFTATRLLPRIISAIRGGDDHLLRAIVGYFEEQGFRVEGPDAVLGGLLASKGVWGRIQPTAEQWSDVEHALRVTARLGSLDIGQGAVVARGLVLAVEAAEGTDQMLRRCADLPEHLRGTAKERVGVLVKQPKPGQERRIDLPTVGVRTVEGVAAAGLAGIAVAEGGSLVMDRDDMVRAADAAGIFVMGVEPVIDPLAEDLAAKPKGEG